MFYNPNTPDEGGGSAKPGIYAWKLDDIQEKTFSSGNKGAKATLLVDVDGRFIKVFCNLVDSPKSIWMIKGFMAAMGLDYKAPPASPLELIGRLGRAEFKVGDKGYLEVKKFIEAASVQTAPSAPAASTKTSAAQVPSTPKSDDDVPF